MIKLSSDQERFFPPNQYDTYDSNELREAVLGSTTYAFGVWFKPTAYPTTGATTLIYDMTMLE